MAAMCTCSAMSIFLLGKNISFMSVSNSATLFSRPQYAIVIKIFYSGMCTQLCKNNLLLYWSNLGTSKILFHNCVASDIRIIIKLLSCVSDAYLCRTIYYYIGQIQVNPKYYFTIVQLVIFTLLKNCRHVSPISIGVVQASITTILPHTVAWKLPLWQQCVLAVPSPSSSLVRKLVSCQ